MKLLIVTDTGIYGGGAENRIRTLIQKLIKNCFFEEIHIVSKQQVKMPKVISHLASDEFIRLEIRKIIKQYDIDIVQVHNSFDFAANAIAEAKKLNKPVIFFAHDYWPICSKRILFFRGKSCPGPSLIRCSRCVGLLSYLKTKQNGNKVAMANIAISPTRFVQRIFEQNNVLSSKWRVMKPWLDLTDLSNNVLKKENFILFIGPIAPFKGAFTLIKAMKRVLQKIPDLKLYFIGDGQEKSSRHRVHIDALITKYGITKNIRFLGQKKRKALFNYLKKAKLYVCPPIWPELFGQTWAEAMVAGCLVIATGVGSIPELSKNKIPLIDNPLNYALLSEKIIQGLTDKAYLSKQRKYQNFALREFNLNRSFAVLQKIYENL